MPANRATWRPRLAALRSNNLDIAAGGSRRSARAASRVAIARAVVKRPAVLLCDEPTRARDDVTGKLVPEVIAHVNRELATTALVITHDAAIAGMADCVEHPGDGRIRRVERNAHRLAPCQLSWCGEPTKTLDRKRRRDLRRLCGQALTIALVVANASLRGRLRAGTEVIVYPPSSVQDGTRIAPRSV